MTDFTPVVQFGLLLVRTGMLVGTAPAFGGLYAPPFVKVGLTVALASLLLPLVAVPVTWTAPTLVLVVAREAAIGLALGMSVRVLLAGAELAGHLAGFQIGFGYAGIVDPQSGVRNTLLATLYATIALLTFLAINGHHVLLQALVESYQALPIGSGHVDASMPQIVMRLLGLMFTIGAQLAAPVVVVLLVVEVAMGLIARAAPAVNLMVIGFPVRVLVGLLILATAVQAIPAVVSRVATPAVELAVRAAFTFR